MDDVTSGLGDVKDQDRIYQKAQIQIDKILDPDAQMPSIFMESKKRLGHIIWVSALVWNCVLCFGKENLCIWLCRAESFTHKLMNISLFVSQWSREALSQTEDEGAAE